MSRVMRWRMTAGGMGNGDTVDEVLRERSLKGGDI